MSRSSGLALPDVGDVFPLLLLGGGAYYLFGPPQGAARLGAAMAAANQAAGTVNSVAGIVSTLVKPTPAATRTAGFPTPTPGAGAGGAGGDCNQWGAANGGDNTFNINCQQSSAIIQIPGGIQAHVGVGHIGSGGTFACILWGQSAGLLGAGAVGPTQIAQQNFDAGHDGQWTGYGIDFSNVPTPFATGVGASIWASIVGLGGEGYTQGTIGPK